jgi:hypothetical protein
MQLSKLEIKGFKSFADKIVINFDEGDYRYCWAKRLRKVKRSGFYPLGVGRAENQRTYDLKKWRT